MILVNNSGQTLFRGAPQRDFVNADNLNALARPGTGFGGNVTDEHWAQQAATAAMRGNKVMLAFLVPWQPESRLKTGWVHVYSPRNKGMQPARMIESVLKTDGRSGQALQEFATHEQDFLRLKADILAGLRHDAFSRLMFSDVLAGRQYTSIQPFSIHYTVPVAARLTEIPDWKYSGKADTRHSCMMTNG
jgi:hypothetical protein